MRLATMNWDTWTEDYDRDPRAAIEQLWLWYADDGVDLSAMDLAYDITDHVMSRSPHGLRPDGHGHAYANEAEAVFTDALSHCEAVIGS